MSEDKWSELPVKIWQEPLVIPTYRIGNHDPNPIFYSGRAYQGAKGPIYPYPLLDKITDIHENKTYDAVFLENKYVKICVLPQIGGRILYAVDKTNKYDLFYHQHVIKPALIGMLGAWISGGVEWNVPHHHRASTFMPVDYSLKENTDGSKTIWVGEIELRHRMKWVIGLTLYPGKSFIEAIVTIFNRTPFANSMLFWANAAVHAGPDYQVIFPPRTEYATFHGKNQFSRWPISHEVFNRVDYTRGVEVSWWKNHPRPTSFFAWNYEDDFYAGYDHGRHAGTVHVADHHIVPGKKFFEWGNGPHGQMWDKILTETDGPYLELMTGAYSDNQPDYSWIMPYEVRTFKEYWYPIRGIGGVKNANIEAAVNLEMTSKKTAKLGFNTTSEHEDAKVVLKTADKIILEQNMDISPEKPFVKEIPLPLGVKEEDLQVSLLSPNNQELITYKPVKKAGAPMPDPVMPPPPPKDIKTIEELYLTGLRLEQFHNPALEPYPYYEEALRRDPEDYRVNTALGLLYCKRGMFKEAEERFNQAIKRVTKNFTTPKDGEAYYYLGMTLRFQGRYDDAYEAFSKSTWHYAWCAAAYYSLAELACLKGDLLKALDFIDRSISSNALNTKAFNLKAAIFRKLGRFEEAERIASMIIAIDPLDFWAGNELYLAKTSVGLKNEAIKELKALNEKMRGVANSYLELAADYGNCGLFDEAVEVLSRSIGPEKEAIVFPLVYYHLGYYWEKKGDESKSLKYYLLGSKMPTDYCFPFQLESIDVLRSVIKSNPQDARAHYYLGNLLYDIQPEKAIEEWERSRDLDDTFSIVHRNLGFAYARIENDVSRAIVSLERAVACNPKDPRLYLELDQLYEAVGASPQKRLELLEKNHKVIVNRDDALLQEIWLFVQLERYDDAIDLMSNHHFHVWEGRAEIHDVYVQAHLLRGERYFRSEKYREALKDYEAALEYPENLEVGGEWNGGWFPRIHYLIATAHEALDDNKKARSFYEQAVAEKSDWSEMSYYQGLAYRKLGKENKANQIFERLTDVGRERLEASSAIDYFAKFGEKQSRATLMAEAHYLLGLGYLGQNRYSEADAEFEETLKLNIYHVGAKTHLSKLK